MAPFLRLVLNLVLTHRGEFLFVMVPAWAFLAIFGRSGGHGLPGRSLLLTEKVSALYTHTVGGNPNFATSSRPANADSRGARVRHHQHQDPVRIALEVVRGRRQAEVAALVGCSR